MTRRWWTLLLAAPTVLLWMAAALAWASVPDEATLCLALTVFAAAWSALAGLLRRRELARLRADPRARGLASLAATSLLLFCVLAAANHLAFKRARAFDLTRNADHTLSDQTRRVLASLTGTLKAVVFAPAAEALAPRMLLDLYRYEAGDMEIDVVDPFARPDLARAHGIPASGAVLLEHGGRTAVAEETSELSVTNAVIRLLRGGPPPLVLVLSGHGGPGLGDEGEHGLSVLAGMLRGLDYRLEEADLRARPRIPGDAGAVVVWGPEGGFTEEELGVLGRWLDGGGDLVLGVGPGFGGPGPGALRAFLAGRGLAVPNRLVVDAESHVDGSRGAVPMSSRLDRSHRITAGLSGPVFLPLAGPVGPEAREGRAVARLVESSPFPGSWALADPGALARGGGSFTDGSDEPGPLALAAAVEEGGSRAVLFGNAAFVSNRYARFPENFRLFVRALSWAVHEDEIASFDRPVLPDGPVIVGRPALGVVFYVSVLLVPAVLLCLALLLHRRRTGGGR